MELDAHRRYEEKSVPRPRRAVRRNAGENELCEVASPAGAAVYSDALWTRLESLGGLSAVVRSDAVAPGEEMSQG
jgi:hypothetical protein